MIRLLSYLLTPFYRLRGRWERRGMRRQHPPIPLSPEEARMALLQRRYAKRHIPPGFTSML